MNLPTSLSLFFLSNIYSSPLRYQAMDTKNHRALSLPQGSQCGGSKLPLPDGGRALVAGGVCDRFRHMWDLSLQNVLCLQGFFLLVIVFIPMHTFSPAICMKLPLKNPNSQFFNSPPCSSRSWVGPLVMHLLREISGFPKSHCASTAIWIFRCWRPGVREFAHS